MLVRCRDRGRKGAVVSRDLLLILGFLLLGVALFTVIAILEAT
jgi:hypothetical protein